MAWLLLGLVLFLGPHTFTTARGARGATVSRLGENAYKGLYALIVATGLVLIVVGFGSYRDGGYIQIWTPPKALHPVALVLLWAAFVALSAAYAPASRIKSLLRHPMLVGVKTWALSHLLVNGDLGSMLVFGALLIWAVYDRIAVKRRGDYGAPAVGWSKNDLLVIVIGSVAYIAMSWLHDILIGVAVT